MLTSLAITVGSSTAAFVVFIGILEVHFQASCRNGGE